MSDNLQNIHLQSLWPRGCHPQRLLGRFVGDDLVFALAPDMALSWERLPKETPEAFEHRIVDGILFARHLPPLPQPLPRVADMIAHAPPRPRIVGGGNHDTHARRLRTHAKVASR